MNIYPRPRKPTHYTFFSETGKNLLFPEFLQGILLTAITVKYSIFDSIYFPSNWNSPLPLISILCREKRHHVRWPLSLSLPPGLFLPLISHQTTFSCTRKIPNFSCQHNGIFKEFAGWRLTGVPNWINIFLFTEGFPPFLRVLGLLSLQLHLAIMLPWRRAIRTFNDAFNSCVQCFWFGFVTAVRNYRWYI